VTGQRLAAERAAAAVCLRFPDVDPMRLVHIVPKAFVSRLATSAAITNAPG
jgi:hypothetical protein